MGVSYMSEKEAHLIYADKFIALIKKFTVCLSVICSVGLAFFEMQSTSSDLQSARPLSPLDALAAATTINDPNHDSV